MCGIAGIIVFQPNQPVHTMIEQMTKTISHRGPDDEGYAFFTSTSYDIFGGEDTPESCYSAHLPYTPKKNGFRDLSQPYTLALGHRRLAIIDVTPTGHQPMCYDNQNYWIILNGEIYNYLELRAELEALGYSFISSSDTEVVMAAYREWGVECLQRFNGMFAFLLYDRRRNTIFAARDRFGVKPLYYWRSPAGFLAIASEIKEFTVLPGWSACCNPRKTFDFLSSGLTDHTDETMFDGVFQLRGGFSIECTIEELRSRVPVRRWYDLDCRSSELLEIDFQEAVLSFRNLFEDAVSIRLRADVPVGTGLSGGLDSSSIVCMANLIRRNFEQVDQYSFSACTEEKSLDERPYIESVVRHTGVNSFYTFPAYDGIFQVLNKMVYHHDEPFPGASIFAEWSVYKLVATTPVKVTLDGHGADEILAGYHSFYRPYFAKMLRELKIARFLSELRYIDSNRLRVLQGAILNLLPYSLAYLFMRIVKSNAETLRWFNRDWAKLSEWGWSEYANDYYKMDIRNLSLLQMTQTSLPNQLRWCDRDSMAFSVESRAPFLDYRLVEFMLRSPDSFKINEAETKYILRKALGDLLPPAVLSRKDKIGFAMPESTWVKANASQFDQVFKSAIETLSPILNKEAVLRAMGGSDSYNPALWRLMTLGSWVDVFKVKL